MWLIRYKKHTGTPTVTYDEAVEEALCFGWIDSKPSVLDDKRSMLWMAPRKPKSTWSRLNKQRVARLVEARRMTNAGLGAINRAKKDGSWNTLDAVENLTVPKDLQRAMAGKAAAKKNFNAFSNSSKKIILGWIHAAKRPETRAKRIGETVAMAAKNLKANHYRQ